MFSVYTSGGGDGGGGGGTAYTDEDLQTIEQTWNDAGTIFTGIGLDVTDTASDAASLLMKLSIGGSRKFEVGKTGIIKALRYDTLGGANDLYAAGTPVLRATQTGGVQVGPELWFGPGALNTAVALVYEDTHVLGMRNGDNVQKLRVYSDYVDAANNRYIQIYKNAAGAQEIAAVSNGTFGVTNLVLNAGNNVHFNRGGTLLATMSMNTFQPWTGSMSFGAAGSSNRIVNVFTKGYLDCSEIATPANPAADSLRLYAKDDGAGVTQLAYLTSDGTETIVGSGGGGTAYTDEDLQTIEQTWNDVGTVFNGIGLDVTDTASDASSLLVGLRIGGVSKLEVDKAGRAKSADGFGSISGQLDLYAGSTLVASFVSTGPEARIASKLSFGAGPATPDTYLLREEADTLGMRNGGTPQEFRVYSGYVSSSDYRRFYIREDASERLALGVEALGAGADRTETLNLELTNGFRMSNASLGDYLQVTPNNMTPFVSSTTPYSLGKSWGRFDDSYWQGFFDIEEMTAPSTPAANTCRLYVKDNGSGKTQLVVKMPDGVETVLATQS